MFPLLYFYSDWGLFVVRLVLAFVLIVHGWPKLKDMKGTAAWMDSIGFKPGFVFAPLAAVLEFFGGLALIFGVLTQVVALLLIVEFLIIIVWKIFTGHKIVSDLEVDLLCLITAITIVTAGSGAWSLESFFIR